MSQRILRVLIVDDLVVNRVLLREIVKEIGYEYVLVENGREALSKLSSEHFDMILMDVEMPVMNGLETTRYIRNNLQPPLCNIPIIAITAHNPKIFFEDFRDVGFNEILTKPYSAIKIKELISSFL
jgi:two-component system, response regulator, stage 0 sporulation protein F